MLKSIELVEGNDQRHDRLARDDKTLAESILSTQIADFKVVAEKHIEKKEKRRAHFCNIFACRLWLWFLLSPENLQHAFYNCCISYYDDCIFVFFVFCFACLSFVLKSVDRACEFWGRIAIGMPRSTMHGRGNLRVTLKRSKQTKQTKCEVGFACAGSLLTITRLDYDHVRLDSCWLEFKQNQHRSTMSNHRSFEAGNF